MCRAWAPLKDSSPCPRPRSGLPRRRRWRSVWRTRRLAVPSCGAYRFKYLGDGGSWFCEPEADGVEMNEYAELDSVLVA